MEDERELISSEDREATAADDVEAHSISVEDKSAAPTDEDEERRVLPES